MIDRPNYIELDKMIGAQNTTGQVENGIDNFLEQNFADYLEERGGYVAVTSPSVRPIEDTDMQSNRSRARK